MKTIITIAIVALLASPMYVEARNTKVNPEYNSAPDASAELESTPSPEAPEERRGGSGGGSRSNSDLKKKVELLQRIVELMTYLRELQEGNVPVEFTFKG